MCAVGGYNKHNPMPFSARSRNGATCGQTLVIWVRVKTNERRHLFCAGALLDNATRNQLVNILNTPRLQNFARIFARDNRPM
jgi:hypothetical protein